ncbi:MAG: cytidine deaminase, partial [Calditrichaeota bacterium]|nr:cytidine deaminase [Calditrichota bacterium]
RFRWERDGDWLETKYPYVVHAEANAILNSTINDLHGCRIYATLFPCNECAKHIAQKKIAEVVFLSDKYRGEKFHEASERIFGAAGIATRKLEMPSLPELVDKFERYIR